MVLNLLILSLILVSISFTYVLVCKLQLFMLGQELIQREDKSAELWNRVQRYRRFIRHRAGVKDEDPAVTTMKIKRIDEGKQ